MRHDGLIEHRSYDAQNRLVRVVDFSGGITRFERDAFSRVVAVTDPLGHTMRYSYVEAPGTDFWTASAITRPDGVTTTRHLEVSAATVTVTDGERRRTIYRYGPFNLLEEIQDPQGGKLRFAYDHQERLERVTNQLSRQWTFERDAAGRIIRETDFDGVTLDFTYDRGIRPIEVRRSDGTRLLNTYDGTARLLREEVWQLEAAAPKVTTFAYDERGLLSFAQNETALAG